MSAPAVPLEREFTEHWMLWLVLHHFLSAPDLRLLSEIVVREASDGRTDLSSLFESLLSDNRPWADTWLLEPLPTKDQEASYLQGLVRSLVWRNDTGGWPPFDDKAQRSGTPPRLLGRVTALAPADLDWPATFVEELLGSSAALQESFVCFARLFQAAQKTPAAASTEDFWVTVEPFCEGIPMPLRALSMKHLADLCADLDHWERSESGYAKTRELLEGWTSHPSWGSARATWLGITRQSTASAVGVVVGPRASAELLKEVLEHADIYSAPLLRANASLDAVVALSHPDVEWLKAGDRRVYVGSVTTQRRPFGRLSVGSTRMLTGNFGPHSDARLVSVPLPRRNRRNGGMRRA
jgi:hypothetical protein